MALAALGCCLQYRVARSFQEKRTFVLTVQAFAFIVGATSQCERSASCRVQAGEGSRLRPIPRSQDPLHHGNAAPRRREGDSCARTQPFLRDYRYHVCRGWEPSFASAHSCEVCRQEGGILARRAGAARGLPIKQHKLIQAWIALHEQELQDNWYLASHRSDCCRIEPLR